MIAAAVPASAACDRTCLRHTLDRYLTAVIAHRPGDAALAAAFRSTENAAETPVGSGLWVTATGLGRVQRRYLDPVSDNAAYFGTLAEGDAIDIVALRLKVVDRRVSEAEWTIARKQYGGMFSPDGLLHDQAPPDRPLRAADRTPRAALIAAADAYFAGLESHDGTAVPHIPGCDRVENGVKVTNRSGPLPPGMGPPPGAPAGGPPGMMQEGGTGDCVSGFDRFAHSIAATSHRRYLVVDEEAGVVLGATLFQRPAGSPIKRNLLSEFFWMRRGQIASIAAAMFYLDAAAPDTPGW